MYMNFPNRSTDCGKLINAFLTNQQDFDHETIHLLFTMNRWESKKQMERLLNEGTSLIVDRYSYSGVAYSAAKGNRHSIRLEASNWQSLYYRFKSRLVQRSWKESAKTGSCFVLDANNGCYSETWWLRWRKVFAKHFFLQEEGNILFDFRHDVYELQQKVNRNFEALFDADYWQRINADKSENDLQKELQMIVEKVIDESTAGPLKLLW